MCSSFLDNLVLGGYELPFHNIYFVLRTLKKSVFLHFLGKSSNFIKMKISGGFPSCNSI
jgi:hypothetical protein